MTKHIGGEGEWKWVVKGQNIVTANGEIGIAKVYDNIGQPRKVHAALIAASPLMLKALEDLIDCNTGTEGYNNWIAAQEIVRKAKGE